MSYDETQLVPDWVQEVVAPAPPVPLTPTGRVQTPFARMMPKHYLILRYRLEGKTNREIAELVGMTPEGIGLVAKQPIFQQMEERRRLELSKEENTSIVQNMQRASQELSAISFRAVDRMGEVLETSTDHKVILDAGDKILKHAFGATEGIRAKGGGINAQILVLSDSKLSELRSVLSEIGLISEGNPAKPVVSHEVMAGGEHQPDEAAE